MHRHIDELLGTVTGTVLGFISAWDLTRFADEIETVKLAAIGAVTGFLITSVLKFLKKKLDEILSRRTK